jgi:hypothetical protein
LRKAGELKIDKFDVVFVGAPDEGGLAVVNSEATLVHRSSVDRVSFPKLRGAIVDATQLSKDGVHLEETKVAKALEVKAAAAPVVVPPREIPTIEQINTMVAEPVRPPPAIVVPPPVEIGVILPIEPPAPPMPKKSRQAINKATRAHAAARPPPIDVAPAPLPQPLPSPPPPPAPPATPSQRVFGYTYPKAAPTPAPAIVFGFRK